VLSNQVLVDLESTNKIQGNIGTPCDYSYYGCGEGKYLVTEGDYPCFPLAV